MIAKKTPENIVLPRSHAVSNACYEILAAGKPGDEWTDEAFLAALADRGFKTVFGPEGKHIPLVISTTNQNAPGNVYAYQHRAMRRVHRQHGREWKRTPLGAGRIRCLMPPERVDSREDEMAVIRSRVLAHSKHLESTIAEQGLSDGETKRLTADAASTRLLVSVTKPSFVRAAALAADPREEVKRLTERTLAASEAKE